MYVFIYMQYDGCHAGSSQVSVPPRGCDAVSILAVVTVSTLSAVRQACDGAGYVIEHGGGGDV